MGSTDPVDDRELVAEVWRFYDERYADHVGDFVSPYEYLDSEEQVDQLARNVMFGYAIGAVAGAHAVAPEAIDGEVTAERVASVVDAVVDLHESAASPVSSERVAADLLAE